MTSKIRLGVNIDHVATLRNARGSTHPDPVRAARVAAVAGADQVTAHLREDRRHIGDADIARLKREGPLPLNMELAATEEMIAIALEQKPAACCLVPEQRQELTTEGGLDIASQREDLSKVAARLKEAGIPVSLFIDPEPDQVDAAKAAGADAVELHTGAYANAAADARKGELGRLEAAAERAAGQELRVHAGHGLDYANVGQVAAIQAVEEVNIGHYIVGEALFAGLENAIRRMVAEIDGGRRGTKYRPTG